MTPMTPVTVLFQLIPKALASYKTLDSFSVIGVTISHSPHPDWYFQGVVSVTSDVILSSFDVTL
jgi:hypothetical protein